jgi:hypothetical protein
MKRLDRRDRPSPIALAGGIAALIVAQGGHPADLIDHNGFDVCWTQAIGEAQFTGLQQSAIDGTTNCIPATSNASCGPGCTYSACYTTACPGGVVGCPVTLHSTAFAGGFTPGASHFTASGTADQISVPITYSSVVSGSCTVTISNINLSYALDYTMQNDGNNGLYAASLDQTTVTIDSGYTIDSTDLICKSFAPTLAPQLVGPAQTAAATLVTAQETLATVEETVCPVPAG